MKFNGPLSFMQTTNPLWHRTGPTMICLSKVTGDLIMVLDAKPVDQDITGHPAHEHLHQDSSQAIQTSFTQFTINSHFKIMVALQNKPGDKVNRGR